jgi:hypothetical protein
VIGAFQGSSKPKKNMMALTNMLRPTGRLLKHLKSNGQVLIAYEKGGEKTLYHLQEVEFVPEHRVPDPVPSFDENNSNIAPSQFIIPPGFNFWVLEALLKRGGDCRDPHIVDLEYFYEDLYRREQDSRVQASEKSSPVEWCFDNQSINILWLSPNEFVSPLEFNGKDSYSVDFSFNRRSTKSSQWCTLQLYAYHLENFPYGDVSFPGVTLQFLQHIIPPVVDKISNICFDLSTGRECVVPPTVVASMLEIVPTNAPHQTACTENAFLRVLFNGNLSEEHAEVFVNYPFRPNVRFGFSQHEGFTAERYNHFLLRFRHLRHIEVPFDLEYIDCDKRLFTANAGFESVAILVWGKFPLKMMEGISENSNIKHLIVHHPRGLAPDHTPTNILEMLRRQIQSLNQLTIQCTVFSWEGRFDEARPAIDRCFRDWWELLCSDKNKAITQSWKLSSFRFEFQDGREEPFIKIRGWHPTESRWDTLVVPSLALNWYRQVRQRQSLSTVTADKTEIRLLALAIRAVNHGVVYRKATNIIPSNPFSCHSTVIYHMLQQHMYPLMKCQCFKEQTCHAVELKGPSIVDA